MYRVSSSFLKPVVSSAKEGSGHLDWGRREMVVKEGSMRKEMYLATLTWVLAELLVFRDKVKAYASEGYLLFEKLLLSCCWALGEAELLTPVYQATMGAEFSIMSWLLSDLLNLSLFGCSSRWSTGQRYVSKWPNFHITKLHYSEWLSLNSDLWYN